MSQLSLNKKKIPILLLENTALEEQELVDKLKDFKIVGLRHTQFTKEVLEQSEHLIAIGCFCIGTNQVDLKTAQSLGIPVFNAPFSNTRSVAELVLAEAILLIRNVIDKNAKVHRGEWLKSANNANEVSAKLIKYLDNGSTLNAVNFPELSLPSHTETHRILHIHQNIPGIINELNRILASKNINVEGQYLRTLENIGYVVMDIKSSSDQAKDLIDEFKKVKATIKARYLV
ncbi:hypothetical protein AS144_05325 [Francisella endosymbiont of Amblyomma maculatum]|nr:hypothetical protein AS144_05325 [Francisella endosymbiont of Amblyomma maculatum]